MQVVAGGRAVLRLPADRAADLHYAGSVRAGGGPKMQISFLDPLN